MSEPVNGTLIMLYKHDVDTDTDIPFACARTSSFRAVQSFKDVTDYASAFFRKVKPDVCSWEMSISGLVILSNYSYLFVSDLILSRESILVKYVIDNGTDGLVIYAGSAYPDGLEVVGNYNEAGTYSTTLVGTGAFNSTGTQVTPTGILVEGGSVTRFEYTVASESAAVVIASTIGASVITIFGRGGSDTPQIIYSGTPTGSQIKFTTATGTFTAPSDNPFLAGELLFGNFK